MIIGIEAQRIFRKNKHGMDYVVLQEIKELQQRDTENEYDRNRRYEPPQTLPPLIIPLSPHLPAVTTDTACYKVENPAYDFCRTQGRKSVNYGLRRWKEPEKICPKGA